MCGITLRISRLGNVPGFLSRMYKILGPLLILCMHAPPALILRGVTSFVLHMTTSQFVNRGWSGISSMLRCRFLQRSGLLVGLPWGQGTDCTAHVGIEKSDTVDVTGVNPAKSATFTALVTVLGSNLVRMLRVTDIVLLDDNTIEPVSWLHLRNQISPDRSRRESVEVPIRRGSPIDDHQVLRKEGGPSQQEDRLDEEYKHQPTLPRRLWRTRIQCARS
ncbi:hypothetical protein KCU91_g79, partial [Aureobasidium melanogenum]